MAKHKRLSQLLKIVGYTDTLAKQQTVTGLAIDSREVQAGDLFVALAGHQQHGFQFAQQAEQQGAVAILAETPLSQELSEQKVNIPVYEIDQLSPQLGVLAAHFFDHPSEQIKVVAVTGTNGKTSTAWLLVQALQQLNVNAAYMGTLGVGTLDSLEKLANTTPSALHIQAHLADLVSRGFDMVCLEASSHALVQGRLNGLNIDTAILTNISQDHLDYHHTMTAYAEAKQILFTDFKLRHAIINSDDEYGQHWLQAGVNADTISIYGQTQKTAQHHHSAHHVELKDAGLAFQWQHNEQYYPVSSSLLGRFNVDNLLAVLASLIGIDQDEMNHGDMDLSAEHISQTMAQLTPVPGRMNMIRLTHKPVTVVIDFAHTPDALAQVLKALSAHCQHDLWCVFGCGGDRDKSKRPQMGQIAESFAQHIIITDDNPRFESADEIAADIAQGMSRSPLIIHNRKAAIERALQQSAKGDVILIAGKGHETTQQINDQYIEFNDFQVVQNWQEAAA